MKTHKHHRNGANQTRTSARPVCRPPSSAACAIESLETRQLYSVTGFSLVNEASTFGGKDTTVTNQPSIFQSTLQKSWMALISGQMKINGQTLRQEIASGIQTAETKQGLSAYNIISGFDGKPSYTGTLKQTPSGAVLEMTFDAKENQTSFSSTTNSIFGSWADPSFNVTYDLDLTVDLSLPLNLAKGKVTAKAEATASNVTVSTDNVLVGLADVFGANIPERIAEGINGRQENLSSIVPTGLLNSALQLEAAQGYTHLQANLNSSGNLVLTAQKPTITVNAKANDHVNISAGSDNSVVITASGNTQTFADGLLKRIIVNDNATGTDTVDVPSLPKGVAVQITDSRGTDNVTIGGTGSLDSVAGTVSVAGSSGNTALMVNDSSDPGRSNLKITNNAVKFNGRNVVTYSAGKGKTVLTVKGGAHGSDVTIESTASSVPLTIQTGTGADNNVTIDGSKSAITDLGMGGTVTVGNGSLAAIGGTVNVSNFGNVVIDDSKDTKTRKVTLTSTPELLSNASAVAFGGLATIDLGYVEGVKIYDGPSARGGLFGNNTFDAQGSPSKDFFTIFGHLGDQVAGPAAAQVQLNVTLPGLPKVP
jgi:hypothetical protein